MLFIDVGNTALKWRWVDAGGVRQGDSVHHRDWASLPALMDVEWQRLSRIEVASVAGREADAALAAVLRSVSPVEPRFYYSRNCDAGVVNAYSEPERLGVDRWLAVIEGWNRYGPVLIVDCGSALTLDAVDKDGMHKGGYIVPGLGMLERSLVQGTGSVRVDFVGVDDSTAPGRSTSEGVRRGVLRMTVAFITDAVVALREGLPDTAPVLLTGGDAERVARLLTFPVKLAPDLVLDGLERVTATDTGVY
ncbi:type III pantothenate kinase [Alcanivorax sp. 1008]|uniref:type III pantothenate kinase n=1 Tax=Alcanivorax sp. 1008 TaxID=2816853 RepID=UPI001D74D324|nr:type III pantothenate kinase [Alcanivorax sp. 1008]MCC1497564.1 type III pantothenate kinase [Alcanivorax sp. 1008]